MGVSFLVFGLLSLGGRKVEEEHRRIDSEDAKREVETMLEKHRPVRCISLGRHSEKCLCEKSRRARLPLEAQDVTTHACCAFLTYCYYYSSILASNGWKTIALTGR